MDATAVRFTLSNIHCSDEGDGIGSADPYLWTVFFKVDGDTAHVANLQLIGTATAVATPGDHGDLNDTDVSAGDNVPIPSSLGNFTAFVKPIPQDNGAPLPGVAGYIAVLLNRTARRTTRLRPATPPSTRPSSPRSTS